MQPLPPPEIIFFFRFQDFVSSVIGKIATTDWFIKPDPLRGRKKSSPFSKGFEDNHPFVKIFFSFGWNLEKKGFSISFFLLWYGLVYEVP